MQCSQFVDPVAVWLAIVALLLFCLVLPELGQGPLHLTPLGKQMECTGKKRQIQTLKKKKFKLSF